MNDTVTTAAGATAAAVHSIVTDRLRLRVATTPTSARVIDLEDRATGVCWFASATPRPLISIRRVDDVRHDELDSLTGTTSVLAQGVDGRLVTELTLGAGVLDAEVHVIPEGSALHFEARLTNRTRTAVSVDVRLPWFLLEPEAAQDVLGMVPIEIGSVRPLADGPLHNRGHFAHRTFACATSVVPLAHVGNEGLGSGIVIAGDLARGATQVLEAAIDGVGCRSTVFLGPGESGTIGPVQVWADDGRWQTAVDAFRERRPLAVVKAPDWLRRAGAIYNPVGEGGGGIYQEESTISLAERISSFDELPDLLAEARRLGTDVLYLFDYWEKDSDGARPAYWHKGAYLPRGDLGGEAALRRGVRAVRAGGGHVLMYLEPFIVYSASALGRSEGGRLAARDPWTGEPITTYPDNITTVPWDPSWRDYIASRAEWLVGDIGADGIFLDSFGWQWNWVCSILGERVRDAAAWNRGVVTLAAEVRERIRRREPDAVVVTEGLTGELAAAVDAGLDASFAWNQELNLAGILRSPVRRGYPAFTFFSNGRDEAQLKQVFAAGHGLALSQRWLKSAKLVADLVRLRRTWADALVDGEADEVARSGDGLVAATLYAGHRRRVLVALNASDEGRRLTFSCDSALNRDWAPILAGTPADPSFELPPGALAAWNADG